MKRLAILPLALLGCAGPWTKGQLYELARPAVAFAPPAQYAAWYAEVVRDCACEPRAQLWDLTFHTMPVGPNGTFRCDVPQGCLGWWWEDDTIFLAQGQERTEWVVKHEMAHAIAHTGDENHPLVRRYHA